MSTTLPSGGRVHLSGDIPELVQTLLADPPIAEADAFIDRLGATWSEFATAFDAVYGDHSGRDAAIEAIVRLMVTRWMARSAELRALDAAREARPDWFQTPDMIGYVFYVDRFAGTLRGVLDHIDYLRDLGVRYVHLMPLLKPRVGDHDGGYAVADYRAVRPDLGTMDDLEVVASHFREQGISTCIDLVINHTAAEHPWALAAAAGDPTYSGYYRIYPDRAEPDAFEWTLPEVFPDFAPGNFTQLPDGRWVWTTFNRWQWDLDWTNPRVFEEVLGILLDLANRGIDVFRLDAVAFMWKRLGTNCQNQPEVHHLLRALRACARVAAPAVIFKAEAIVAPGDLAPYLGVAAPGVSAGRECDLAYHNSLMVQFWSSLATGDTRLMTRVLSRFPHKPSTTAWGTYLRCHDDIGWAIMEEDAAAVGWTGAPHRAFLSSFYSGTFPGSFARGVVFQHNPTTGDSRISGALASLAGLESALGGSDPRGVEMAIARILAGHALILGWDGIPLLYMGDEIGLLNDWRYLQRPSARRRQPLGAPSADGLAAGRAANGPQLHPGSDLRRHQEAHRDPRRSAAAACSSTPAGARCRRPGALRLPARHRWTRRSSRSTTSRSCRSDSLGPSSHDTYRKVGVTRSRAGGSNRTRTSRSGPTTPAGLWARAHPLGGRPVGRSPRRRSRVVSRPARSGRCIPGCGGPCRGG